ncbi:MAG: SDR family oxidoreductase [Phaeodactylibacter sp.]|nr:SDR family oxidoreductase [Phaeodactylibacter sp.]MCB9299445.1 SDR family oxidoreductase [Lewinellaceae bacterium]
MRILLTGATGYIGKRLLPVLLEQGHQVICCVRNPESFEWKDGWKGKVELFQVDFLDPVDVSRAPLEFDAAFYLIHSMSSSINDFDELEERSALHFRDYLDHSSARQLVYLSGMANQEELSKHLESRFRVEQLLGQGKVPLTTLRAGIVIGSGSASFEIIRDLVEKLPVMVTPRWLKTRCQPVAIRDVITFLTGVMLRAETYGQNFDIGGRDVLTYQQMMEGYARARKLKRWIFTLPVMTPRLSSYWLYFVTSTTYSLAVNLVNSMKVDVVARDNRLAELLGIRPMGYEEAVQLAFDKIEQNLVVSSWKDALVSSYPLGSLKQYVKVPRYGCFVDEKQIPITHNSVGQVWENVCSIGGQRGWYYANWLWKVRGILDKLVGGIGLRRGRTHPTNIHAGDALDFWRVLVADDEQKRLLLYAEMKLPGEAWLEFQIRGKGGQAMLYQLATFRPHGLFGRLYWYAVLPLHFFIFNGMIRNMERHQPKVSAPHYL